MTTSKVIRNDIRVIPERFWQIYISTTKLSCHAIYLTYLKVYAMRYDPDMLLYYYEDIITKSKKENNMRLDDAKIIFGNKIYRALGVNWEQTCDAYPRI
jgi:hypothetical protein